MGIWDLVKGEIIEVIQWLDHSEDIIVWRFPDDDHEIKMGARLTVREGQAAVFVNEGRIADVFKPGLYSLSTQNMPVMTTLRSWRYGFESPFKADVYFVSTRKFLDLKWGTQNPMTLRDPELGMVRLRAFGTYGIKVTEPGDFIREIVGTLGCFTTEEIEGQLRSMVVSALTNLLGESQIAVLDLAANYKAIGDQARCSLEREFGELGLSLVKFVIENISLPPEVEKMVDVRSRMSLAGDLGRLTRFQTAQAIPEAARSGGAGPMIGLGAGMAMGKEMASAMGSEISQLKDSADRGAASGSPLGKKFCDQCGKPVPTTAKFCPECGVALLTNCPKCGNLPDPAARFCSECGQKLN